MHGPVALGMLSPGTANATCGEECDGQYASDIDDCRSQYGDDPADAQELADCIQEARDDYRSCVMDCANKASWLPRWRNFVAEALTTTQGQLAAVQALWATTSRRSK
jgi:hypothetical protein